MRATKKTVDTFLSETFRMIESDSIRAWAQTAHNLPLIRAQAQAYIERLNKPAIPDPAYFSMMLTSIAIGL